MFLHNKDIIKYSCCYLIGTVIGTIGKAVGMPLFPLLLIGVMAAVVFLWLWDTFVKEQL